MLKRLIFLFGLLSVSATLVADQLYQADVEGMVCAFCAYSVSRDIAKLPGVNADSVDVDLENGKVTFSSAQVVSGDALTAIFSSTGFTVSGLRKADNDTTADVDYRLALDLSISADKIAVLESVLESVGELAASNLSKITLSAPTALETAILKPVLMGRQQTIRVRFLPIEGNTVRLQLFLGKDDN